MLTHQHEGYEPRGEVSSLIPDWHFSPEKPLQVGLFRVVSTLKPTLVAFGCDSQQLLYIVNFCISCRMSVYIANGA